jgi:hypothetical protein
MMATKQCIMVPTLVGVSPGIAVQGSSSQVQGKRMQAFMRQTSTASSNRISLLQALTQQTVVQSQRCNIHSLAPFLQQVFSPEHGGCSLPQ